MLLQEIAQLRAALDRLVARAIAQGVEDCRGGFDAKVTGEQRRFQLFERAFVHRAGKRGNVRDFGGKGLAGARDGLPHAVEEVLPRLFCCGVFGFLAAKKRLNHCWFQFKAAELATKTMASCPEGVQVGHPVLLSQVSKSGNDIPESAANQNHQSEPRKAERRD